MSLRPHRVVGRVREHRPELPQVAIGRLVVDLCGERPVRRDRVDASFPTGTDQTALLQGDPLLVGLSRQLDHETSAYFPQVVGGKVTS